MKLAGQILIYVAVAAAGAALTKAFHPRAPVLYLQDEPLRDDEVTIERIEQEWGGDVIWIDARDFEDYEKEHQPGAILLNEEDWTNLLLENWERIQDATRPLVVYCASHSCQASRKVADRLRENTGMENIFVLRGGWKALQDRERRKM